MYIQVRQGNTTTYNIITIPSTNYTGASLQAAVQTALNYFYNGLFSVSYDGLKNTIQIRITNGNSFKILTDSELSTFLNNTWTGTNYDPMTPNSCNDIITNRTINVHTYLNPFISGMINLSGFRSIYLTSSTLSNFNTLGAKGENNIIKKVVTASDFGYLIVSDLESDHDFLDCSRMTLQTIDFQLQDVKGNSIPLHDSPISFTIVFSFKSN
jgi:hypothetical protein